MRINLRRVAALIETETRPCPRLAVRTRMTTKMMKKKKKTRTTSRGTCASLLPPFLHLGLVRFFVFFSIPAFSSSSSSCLLAILRLHFSVISCRPPSPSSFLQICCVAREKGESGDTLRRFFFVSASERTASHATRHPPSPPRRHHRRRRPSNSQLAVLLKKLETRRLPRALYCVARRPATAIFSCLCESLRVSQMF